MIPTPRRRALACHVLTACLVAAVVLLPGLSQAQPAPAATVRPAAEIAARPRVRLLATGGTISNRVGGRLSAEELLAAVPELDRYVRAEAELFSNIASGEMTLVQWLALARRADVRQGQRRGMPQHVKTRARAGAYDTFRSQTVIRFDDGRNRYLHALGQCAHGRQACIRRVGAGGDSGANRLHHGVNLRSLAWHFEFSTVCVLKESQFFQTVPYCCWFQERAHAPLKDWR